MEMGGIVFGQDLGFGLFFEIARKKEAAATVGEANDERVVVFGSCGRKFGRRGIGPEELDGDAVPVERGGVLLVLDARGARRGGGLEACEGGSGVVRTEEEAGDAKVFENSNEAGGVILMRVGEGDGVEVLEAAGPKIGRDGVFAGIAAETLFATGEAGECAAAVNEESAAARRDDEDGVALANVEDGDFELMRSELGREGMHGDEDGSERENEKRSEEKCARAAGTKSEVKREIEERGEEESDEPTRGSRDAVAHERQAGEGGDELALQGDEPTERDGEEMSEGVRSETAGETGEAERNDEAGERNDDEIGEGTGKRDAVEELRHEREHAELEDEGEDEEFEGAEGEAKGEDGGGGGGTCAGRAQMRIEEAGGVAEIEAKLGAPAVEGSVASDVAPIAEGGDVRLDVTL